ncbi:MAG: hypothetical protein ACYC3S_10785 [Chloroflexota bacterium]
MSTGQVEREAVAAIVRGVGLQPDDETPVSLLKNALRFHQNAVRLRELNLWGIDPAVIYRLEEE